eukprot:6455267-Amphidinium_carterae.2
MMFHSNSLWSTPTSNEKQSDAIDAHAASEEKQRDVKCDDFTTSFLMSLEEFASGLLLGSSSLSHLLLLDPALEVKSHNKRMTNSLISHKGWAC